MNNANILPLFDEDFPQGGAPSPSRRDKLRAWLNDCFEKERTQWLLWVPVLWAAGAAAYFALPVEPPIIAAFFLLALSACIALFARKFRRVIFLTALVVAGFLTAQLKTSSLPQLSITENQPPRTYIATLSNIEKRIEGGWRLHLHRPQVAGDAFQPPKKVRLVVRTDIPETLAPGMRVSLKAVLTPLPRPVLPGGYDFGRQLFLKGYGATGFAVSPVMILGRDSAQKPSVFEQARLAVSSAIDDALDGPSAGLAKALLIGDKAGIPQDVKDNYRQAGLAHLLAISGLHMALVASFIFLLFRQGLSFIPGLALSLPLKSIAAGATVVALFAYLGLVGAPISAQRATVMAACVMLAIIVGRSAISLRTAALAGIFLLLFWPENVVDIGFQMSFAAVIALISGYEAMAKPIASLKTRFGPSRGRVLTYMAGIFLSTILAELAVFPLSLYHFNEVTVYGLAGNAFAVPMTAFWIMPMGILGVLLIPAGLSGPAFWAMGLGLDFVTLVTQNIAATPGAFLAMKSPSTLAIATFFIGGLLVCLLRSKLRFCGVVCMGLAPFLGVSAASPTLLVSERGTSLAINTQNDGFVLLRGRRSGFAAQVWARQMGQNGFEDVAKEYQHCDASGCSIGLWPNEHGVISSVALEAWPSTKPLYALEYVREPYALADSCYPGAIVVAPFDTNERCSSALQVFDKPILQNEGPLAITLTADPDTPTSQPTGYPGDASALSNHTDITIKISSAFNGMRPWHPKKGEDPTF